MTKVRKGARRAMVTDCWYAAAAAHAVAREPVAVRVAGRPVVLYRTTGGSAVALEDRCAHRAYPLSAGTLEADAIRCGLCGFVYDSGGQCIGVPTQSRVPFGASVTAFPVREAHGMVWVWLGEPGRARLRRIPDLSWLTDPAWATVSGTADVAASFLLLHENFADVTQVPFVAPEISPEVLASTPPPLDVVVTETTVALRRSFDPAPLPTWQAELAAVPIEEKFRTDQQAFFHSPAVWVDHWDVESDSGNCLRLRFTQLVTPVDPRRSRLHWLVSRDFAVTDAGATERLADLFGGYYDRVVSAMETAQSVLDLDGPGPEVNVSSDVAALKVREIVASLLTEERSAVRARSER